MADERATRQSADGMFSPVNVARASSAIADQIRAAIVSGQLTEGARLAPERELAQEFGVSRVTVRDALRALEAMGLIEVRVGARGGAFVTAPTGAVIGQTMSDMMMMQAISPDDIVEARLVVELGTVTLACARATEEDLAKLEALAERAEASFADGSYTRELSWEFHSLLAHAAHNVAIVGFAASFRSTLSMHPVRTKRGRQSYSDTVAEHRRILDAIVRRDGAAARHEMAHHLLRGTGLEKRESELLDLWRAWPDRPRQRASSRRAK